MNIDTTLTLNMPSIGIRNGPQTNSAPTVNNQANRQANENTLSKQKQDPDKTAASSEPVVSGAVGSFAIDDDKNVVVRFYDDKGNIVAQYPPEDYLQMMKEFKQVNKNLFHTTA